MNRLPVGLALLAALALAGPAPGQVTYSWTGQSTDWASAGSWTPGGGPPTAADIARFLPSAGGTMNPVLSTSQSALSLTFAPNPVFGGWTVTGTGDLTLGGTGNTGLTTFGPAAYTFNGPTLAGSSASNTLGLTVGNSSTLVLTGNSAVTANQGNVVLSGGTLRLDNTATNVSARLQATGTVTVNGGGLFELIGNASGTTQNVGLLNAGSNVIGGVNTYRITPNGTATVLNFANSGTFGTRPGTRGVYRYEATTGNLGDTSGARVTFTGTPFLGANGLLSNTSGGGTVGFAVASDAGGTDFATWTAGTGVIRATPSVVASTAAGLQAAASTDRVQYNPTADQTATATITNGSLRITPASAGLTLALGANNLATNALMLDGTNNFTVTANATALLGGTGTRYVHVNSPAATLTIDGLQVANGGNPTTFAGPGLVDLVGTATQNTLTTTNRFIIAGGVVRGNNTQIGFGATGAGIISLTGGVLEIKNGANGTGTAADFTRPLGAAAGNVTWGAGTTNELGSGGFSAFGSAASVNLGGSATPTAVTWNTGNFVADGYALRFGSARSNAVLSFLNPIALDSGSPGAYLLREVSVTAGTGGDRTVLAGVISGTASTDFLKTGTGTLELAATNTYAGNTLVAGGRLLATNSTSATGTGSVLVGSGATLAGTGTLTPAAGTARVAVQSGGLLTPGTPADAGPDTPGILTVAGELALDAGSTLRIQINTSTAGSGYSQLVTTGPVTLGSTSTLELFTGAAFSPSAGDQLVILSNTGTLTGTFNGLPQNGNGTTTDGLFNFQISYTGTADGSALVGGMSVVVFNFAPVPEPSTVLLAAAGGLGLMRMLRRRFKK